MLNRKFMLASLALPTMCIAVTCLFSGCGKDDSGAAEKALKSETKKLDEVYPFENGAYNKDPVFKAQLEAIRKSANRLADENSRVRARMEELEKECASDAALLAANEEYQNLKAKSEALNRAWGESHVRCQELTRARMLRALSDSKRIKAGEARAKEFPKEEK